MWLKKKYLDGKHYKGTKAKAGGDDTRRRHNNWFGKNPPKGAGMGDGKKAGK